MAVAVVLVLGHTGYIPRGEAHCKVHSVQRDGQLTAVDAIAGSLIIIVYVERIALAHAEVAAIVGDRVMHEP